MRLALLSLLGACTMGCQPREAEAAVDRAALFAPAEVKTLRHYGASGDGRTDDTAAIRRAVVQSDRHCLDGESKTYRVTGTIQVEGNFCLRNAKLVQQLIPVDTNPLIGGKCRATQDTSEVVDCGDSPISDDRMVRLAQWIGVRTLLIRADDGRRIRVNLQNVTVDRGPYAESGSRSDSAAIWIAGADRIDIRDVEITGNGKGFGMLITRSDNVTLDNVWIHDMVWAPYRGAAPLRWEDVRRIGWNSTQIREFRQGRPGERRSSKFYNVRVQEQLACAFLADVHHVRIRNIRIQKCMARFDRGDVPWQTDGLDIGGSSSDISIDGARIDSTWEAIDLVGAGSGINGVTINRARLSNCFSFGLKAGYAIRKLKVDDLRIRNAGLSGVIIYGAIGGASISNVSIRDVGVVQGAAGPYFPWPAGNRAGVHIAQGPGATAGRVYDPADVIIDGLVVANVQHAGRYDFGLLDSANGAVVRRFDATGFGQSRFRAKSP